MSSNDLLEALEAARQLAAQLLTDVDTAANRVDHIRLTARANEAAHLVAKLEAAAKL